MSVISNNQLAGAAGQGGAADFKIDRSLRFNSGDSAYLSRTPSTAGNGKTWTLSTWVKTSSNGSLLCNGVASSGDNGIYVQYFSNTLYVGTWTTSWQWNLITNRVFRDPSAWHHVVVAVDTTQSTTSDRVKIYINGVQETSFSTANYPSQNYDTLVNNTALHAIGRHGNLASGYFDGYLADYHFIDGQALAPTDFGEYDDNNVWQPKEFTGSYATTPSGTTTSISQVGWASSDEANIWDGNTSTRAVGYVNNTVGTISFNPPLTNVTKVETYTQSYNHFLNGSSVSPSGSGNPGWYTLYDNSSSPITLESVGNSYSSSQTVDFYAIRINDTIVNAQTWTPPSGVGFAGSGANSFYLNFADNSSNAALGTDSSGNSNTWTVNNLDTISVGSTVSSGNAYSAAWAGVGTATWSNTDSWSGLSAVSNNAKGYFSSTENLSNGTVISVANGSFGAGSDGSNGWVLRASSIVKLDLTVYPNITEIATTNSDSQTFANRTVVATNPSSGSTLTVTGKCIWFKTTSQMSVSTMGTVNNAAGGAVTADSLIDTPTNYEAGSGNNGGNYPTWNPLTGTNQTFSNGNLEITTATNYLIDSATMYTPPGARKWYWEFVQTARTGTDYTMVGMLPSDSSYVQGTSEIPQNCGGIGLYIGVSGVAYVASGAATAGTTSATFDVGDILGWAFDAENGTVQCYKNGVAQGTQFTNVRTDIGWTFCVTDYDHNTVSTYAINFGQRPFAYTPPTGYVSLCTTNLPDPTIADGSTAFLAKTFTANASNQTITTGFSPDLVWVKSLGNSYGHELYDIVRGTNKRLTSNTTAQELNLANQLTSFNSNGFTLGDASSSNYTNNTASIAWAWDAGTVTNPVGDIWQAGATKYIGIKFASASGGTVSYGATTGSTTVEVWTSSDNSNWTQQGGTLTLSSGHTLTTSDQYVYIRNTSNATFTDWYVAATNGADGHYSSVTYPSGASWSGPGYTDYDWRQDGATLNNNGSIPAIVQSNPSAGFSISTYTGDSSGSSGNIGHGLNATPDFIIFKSRDVADNWAIYHSSMGLTYGEFTNTLFSSSNVQNRWSSLPTSSVIHLGSDTNINTKNHLIYAWTAVEGYSAFGKYEGTNDTNGPFVYTGFRPRWVLIKNADATNEEWMLIDSARDTENDSGKTLYVNTSMLEVDYGLPVNDRHIDILSNGFKVNRGNPINKANTHVYAAFAENPFKFARAR